MFTIVVRALNDGSPAPLTARLDAPGTGRSFQIGTAADAMPISGTEAELLAWLLGRSDGAGPGQGRPRSAPAHPGHLSHPTISLRV